MIKAGKHGMKGADMWLIELLVFIVLVSCIIHLYSKLHDLELISDSYSEYIRNGSDVLKEKYDELKEKISSLEILLNEKEKKEDDTRINVAKLIQDNSIEE